MSGKAPSRYKEKNRNPRPYDRANQGIFGKVASKVKDWFYYVPSWIRTEEVDGSLPVAQTEDDEFTENEEEPTQAVPASQPRLPIRPAKRPRYENNVTNIAQEHQSSFWPGPSTSQGRSGGELEDAEITPLIPNCDIRKKDIQIIANGDDHSENSDNSASTSGCSSLISSQEKPHRSSCLKLSESALQHLQGELKHKSIFKSPMRQDVSLSANMFSSSNTSLNQSNTPLWSCGTQTPMKSMPQRPSPSNRPSFNASSFGGQSPMSIRTKELKIASPFYEGNTTYGGASAYRKKPVTAPYEINSAKSLRNELKVKESSSVEGFECMSSAARRILHTLESMTTPISDAKRIPHVNPGPLDISSTINPPSHRLKSYLSISRRTHIASPKGPPIVNLNALSKVPLLKNNTFKMSMRHSMMEIPIRASSSPSLPKDCLTKTPEDTRGNSGGGKVRSKLRESLHAHTSKAKGFQEPIPEYELPNVPLPLTTPPVFNLSSKVFQTSSNEKKTEASKSGDLEFTFSHPREYEIPRDALQSQQPTENVQFKFNPPLAVVVKKPSMEMGEKRQDTSNDKTATPYKSVNEFLNKLRETSKQPNTHKMSDEIDTRTSKKNKTSTSSMVEDKPFTSGFGDKFKPKPGSWTCSTCLIQNESGDRCPACETPKPTTVTVASSMFKTSTSSGLSGFQQESGSWECETCLVRNKSSTVKCVACEMPKPSSLAPTSTSIITGFGDKFKPQSGTWECSACMLRNIPSVEKCVACNTPNASVSRKDTSSGKDVTKANDSKLVDQIFQSTAGTWECDTCMVRNTHASAKCVACETLKPSKGKAPSSNGNALFKFGTSTSKDAAACKFDSLISKSVPSTIASGFKFGIPADKGKAAEPTTLESNFKFGTPVQVTTASVKPGAIFGSFESNSTPSFGDKAESTINAYKPTGAFKFGDQSTPVTSAGEVSKSNPTETPSGSIFGAKSATPTSGSIVFGTKSAAPTNSSTELGGFKFTPASGATDGFKFGVPSSDKSDNSSSVKLGGSTLISPTTSIAPAVTFRSTASSKNDTIHSTTVSTLANNATPSSVPSTEKSVPAFAFGKVGSTVASTVSPSGNSTVSTFGLFGDSASKPQQSTYFALGEKGVEAKPTSSCPSALTQSTKAATSEASGISPFSFNPPAFNPFSSSIALTSVSQTETKLAVPAIQQTPTSVISSAIPATQMSTTSATAPSLFVFGSHNPVGPATTSFAFGAQTTSASVGATAPKNSASLSFSAPSSNEQKPGFGFKPANKVIDPYASFGFKTATVANPAATPAVSAPFQFGAVSSQPTGGFAFTAPKPEAAPATAKPFTFGADSSKPAFNAFQPNIPSTAASSMPSFNFSNNPPSSSGGISAFGSAQNAGFSFGAKNTLSAPANPLNPSNQPSVFGAQAMQPVFGANTSIPTFGSPAAPAFGALSAPKSESTGGFTFAPSAAAAPTQSAFTAHNSVFGAPSEKKSAMGPTQGAGFNFGMTPQAPQGDTSGNFSTNFSISTPPSFNFGATSTPANQPFQFAAVVEGSSTNTAAAAGPRRIRKAVRRGIRKE